MSFPRYLSYNHANDPFLREHPAHWTLVRADAVLETSRTVVQPSEMSGLNVYHYSIPVLQETGAGQLEDGSTIDSGKTLVQSRCVLVSKLNPRKGTVCIAEPQGDHLTVSSGELIPLIPRHGLVEYVHYVVQSLTYRDRLSSLVESATRSHQRASVDDVLKFAWAFPPPDEQLSIVTFLDRETAKIDALVAEQDRLIALLQEKRQAVISHAVTKGLDPNVPMKNSGVAWIGLIPAHWSVMTLKQVGSLLKGKGGSKQDASDEGVQCVRYGDLYTTHAYLINSSRSRIPLSLADGYFEMQRGDVLFAASGEDMADIGKSAVNLIPEKAYCGGDLVVLRPSIQLDALFSGYAFDAHYAKAQKASLGRGTTVKHVYPDELGRVTVAIPPHNEQQAIAAFVSDELDRIEVLRVGSIQTISLLRERRTALITAAVTGQIDVRGLVETAA